MIGDKDLPLALRQPTFPDPQVAVVGDVALPACAAKDVRASVGGMGQRGVHRMVGGLHPGDLREPVAPVAVALQRPAQLVVPQPQPGGPHRPADGELVEHRGDDAGDGLVGVRQDLTVGLAPHQPDRQAGAQLAAGGLVADPAGQPGS